VYSIHYTLRRLLYEGKAHDASSQEANEEADV